MASFLGVEDPGAPGLTAEFLHRAVGATKQKERVRPQAPPSTPDLASWRQGCASASNILLVNVVIRTTDFNTHIWVGLSDWRLRIDDWGLATTSRSYSAGSAVSVVDDWLW